MQTETLIVVILWLILAAFAILFLFLRWNYNYWGYDDIKSPDPLTYFGNLPSAVTKKRHVVYDICDIYEAYKYTEYFVGIYDKRTPKLLILSPKFARQIYALDFKHFHDNERSKMISDRRDFLTANNPFVAAGEKWKQRRSELAPALNSERIKSIFPTTLEVCKRLINFIEQYQRAPSPMGIDAMDLFLRFTADVMSNSVLGLDCDSFANRPSPLLSMQHQMFKDMSWLYTLNGLLPCLSGLIKGRFITKQFEKFIIELTQKSLEQRKALKAQEGAAAQRVDFLNYMLQLQEEKKLKDKEIASHTLTLLLDGFHAVASVLCHTLLMLARHPEAQQKLRCEITQRLATKCDYDLIRDMPYMDACIHETLRFFPVTFYATKVCTEPIVYTNKNRKKLKIRKGILVTIPQYQMMMDCDIYNDPTEFQPERFLEENGGVKKYMEMGAYWGYGNGPRICLGLQFGFVQIKAALVEILTQFRVKPNAKTRTDYTFDPNYLLPRLKGGVHLDFEGILKDN